MGNIPRQYKFINKVYFNMNLLLNIWYLSSIHQGLWNKKNGQLRREEEILTLLGQ